MSCVELACVANTPFEIIYHLFPFFLTRVISSTLYFLFTYLYPLCIYLGYLTFMESLSHSLGCLLFMGFPPGLCTVTTNVNQLL